MCIKEKLTYLRFFEVQQVTRRTLADQHHEPELCVECMPRAVACVVLVLTYLDTRMSRLLF